MSGSEQAPLTLDGPYTTSLQGGVAMSDQSINPCDESLIDERARLTEFLQSFSVKPTKQQIRKAARDSKFGPINPKLLQQIYAELWPRTFRKILNYSKYPMVSAMGETPICPHCGHEKTKVYVIYWQDDGTAIRLRICRDCQKRFYSREEEEYGLREQCRKNSLELTEKQCTNCGLVLPIQAFRKKDAFYYHAQCNECTNNKRAQLYVREIAKKHGLTVEQYEEILQKQNGGCAICGGTNLGKKHAGGVCQNPLVFDHCHTTGQFRGLLCHKCNQGIGCFGDSTEKLESAIDYLRSRRVHNGSN